MPAKFDRMVDAVKKSLRKQYPKLSDKELSSKAYAMATAQWKKSHGGKAPAREELKDWRVLEFMAPISESVFDDKSDEFIIRGIAINETTTLNNVKYVADELEMAAPSFRNVPILLDHKNEIKNIVGRTTANVNFNAANRRIDFEGKVMDKAIREMIKDGRIQNVSIGAKVRDLIEEDDGSKKAVGIQGLELSLVAVPGDGGANLAQAIDNSLTLKEIANLRENEDEYDDKELLKWAREIVEEADIAEREKGEIEEDVKTLEKEKSKSSKKSKSPSVRRIQLNIHLGGQ